MEYKVEEVISENTWIPSIHTSLVEACEYAATQGNPCRIYRRASNGVWHAVEPDEMPGTTSADAYRIRLMHRAMARSDEELFGRRHLYEACALKLAQRIIAAGL
ncbi:hypothetical protein [Chitinimonas koreensis]|uniref:hypothetical protein n=1 Tax=Chitinimonas koreensis TaxID=356302 RepID=UPI0012F74499|nr:hypothetical protein [Chitinimonas koreensis]QNM95492.1 hypothetical protein H9L41_16695 [Chitinimonas koreensis]